MVEHLRRRRVVHLDRVGEHPDHLRPLHGDPLNDVPTRPSSHGPVPNCWAEQSLPDDALGDLPNRSGVWGGVLDGSPDLHERRREQPEALRRRASGRERPLPACRGWWCSGLVGPYWVNPVAPELPEWGREVTITGVGGVGKTRLAVQVAAEVLPRFLDGRCCASWH